jgi:HEAT repeat protein
MNLPPLIRLSVCLALLTAPVVRGDDVVDTDKKLLEDANVGSDDKSLREFFRKRSPTAQDLAAIDELVRQLGDRSFQRRKRASDELIARGPAAFDSLRRALKSTDLETVRRAEQCLAEIERAGTELPQAAVRQVVRNKMADGIALLLAYVPSADDEIVTETVYTALRMMCDTKKPDEALFKALKDTSVARRAAAAHVLGRHPLKSARDAAAKLLADPDVIVRFRAAESLLVALAAGRARKGIRPRADRPASRRAARHALADRGPPLATTDVHQGRAGNPTQPRRAIGRGTAAVARRVGGVVEQT